MKILKFRGDHIFSIFCSNFVATLQNYESKWDFLIIFRNTENTDNKEICVIPSIDASSSPALGTKHSRFNIQKTGFRSKSNQILFSSTAWHATLCCCWSMSVGNSVRHRSLDQGQRGWKWHPDGGLIGLGTSPATGVLAFPDKFKSGIASRSILV